MEFFGELLVEFLTGLADFAERKHPPFGIRYWLGWLGVLIHVLLFALLTCVTVFFFIFLLEGKGFIHGVVAIVFLLFALFWLWKCGKTILKMWQVNAAATTVQPFRAGRSRAGERLRTWGNTALECKINKIKPAHTRVLFVYT
jgi:hypothetical protein